MSALCKLKLRYLCIFGFVLVFSLWFEYLALSVLSVDYDDSAPSIMAEYTDLIRAANSSDVTDQHESTINEYESKQLLHEQIIANYTLRIAEQQRLLDELGDAVDAQSAAINEYKERENPLSFKNWIKGIGDTELSNDGFSEVCAVPNIPGFELDPLSAAHSDPTYHHIHDCNDKKKWSELIEVDKRSRFLLIHRHECKGQLVEYQSPSILRGNFLKIKDEDLWSTVDHLYRRSSGQTADK